VRKAARLLLVLALGLGLVTLLSGLGLIRDRMSSSAQGGAGTAIVPTGSLDTPTGWIHAVAGHATTVACCVLAAATFVLGLQALLDRSRRRLPAALLTLLAPALMGLALGTDLTGWLSGFSRGAVDGGAPLTATFFEVHVVRLGGLLLGCLGVLAGLLFATTRRRAGEEEEA
jgi:hypothetical protein